MKMKLIPGGDQMSLIRDTEEVIKFLEFAGRKSILNEHAVNCRLTACNNIFAVLNEEEDGLEYILQNLDILVNRFRNRNNNVRGSTLKVYKSRVKSSIEDFKSWSMDPFAWERAVTEKAKSLGLEKRKENHKEKQKKSPEKSKATSAPAEEQPVSIEATETEELGASQKTPMRRLSLPIRPNCSIEISLPKEGITLKDLGRLGMFLYPYCTDLDETHLQWPTIQ